MGDEKKVPVPAMPPLPNRTVANVKTPAPSAPPPVMPTLRRVIDGAPKSIWVKGGTTSSAHDKKVKRDWLDSERRRAEADMERAISSVPIEKGGGVQYTNRLNTHEEQDLPSGKVLLHFVNSKGEPEYEAGIPMQCLADVMIPNNPAFPFELMIVLICPKCKERLPADQSIIQIRQSNKRWSLDARKAGLPIAWPPESRNPTIYKSAGVVMDSEKFDCPRCNWRAVIDKNKVWTLRT